MPIDRFGTIFVVASLAAMVCLVQDRWLIIVGVRTRLLPSWVLTLLRVLHIWHLSHEHASAVLGSEANGSACTLRLLVLLILDHAAIVQSGIGFLELTYVLLEHLLYLDLILLVYPLKVTDAVRAASKDIALVGALRVVGVLGCQVLLVC